MQGQQFENSEKYKYEHADQGRKPEFEVPPKQW